MCLYDFSVSLGRKFKNLVYKIKNVKRKQKQKERNIKKLSFFLGGHYCLWKGMLFFAQDALIS